MKRVALIAAALFSTAALAGGPHGGASPQTQGQTQGQFQAQGQAQGQAQQVINNVSPGAVGGGSLSADSHDKTLVGGSTGLSSTARCLGSMSIAWNAIATTFIVHHCALMEYAERFCRDDIACWKRVANVDDELTDADRVALGVTAAGTAVAEVENVIDSMQAADVNLPSSPGNSDGIITAPNGERWQKVDGEWIEVATATQ